MFVATVYTVRFATEVVLFAAVGLGGYSVGVDGLGARPLGAALAVAAVVVAIACWGLWIAPRAPRRLPDPVRLVTEVALFAWGAAAAVVIASVVLAVLFLVTALAAALAIRWTGEPVPHAVERAERRTTR